MKTGSEDEFSCYELLEQLKQRLVQANLPLLDEPISFNRVGRGWSALLVMSDDAVEIGEGIDGVLHELVEDEESTWPAGWTIQRMQGPFMPPGRLMPETGKIGAWLLEIRSEDEQSEI
jgi:hypothetical protein